jgi:hypothetical protein
VSATTSLRPRVALKELGTLHEVDWAK